jgi:hypothetical protein
MDSNAFWQAQAAELAKQVNRVSETLGSVSSSLNDRPTHKDMMLGFGDFRKEFCGKLDHMETKFDQATAKTEAALDHAINRLTETWDTVADRAVAKELMKREASENRAREAVKRNDEEMERKIRNANRNGAVGVGTGLLGLIAFIAERLGAFG